MYVGSSNSGTGAPGAASLPPFSQGTKMANRLLCLGCITTSSKARGCRRLPVLRDASEANRSRTPSGISIFCATTPPTPRSPCSALLGPASSLSEDSAEWLALRLVNKSAVDSGCWAKLECATPALAAARSASRTSFRCCPIRFASSPRALPSAACSGSTPPSSASLASSLPSLAGARPSNPGPSAPGSPAEALVSPADAGWVDAAPIRGCRAPRTHPSSC
mmetsp:Transcript_10404/g.22810  ORF Transcript_10404/g.22810 Transcript_10404/m.22810 type:complete len:221 (+) Transcript_10404:1489-2151(+)